MIELSFRQNVNKNPSRVSQIPLNDETRVFPPLEREKRFQSKTFVSSSLERFAGRVKVLLSSSKLRSLFNFPLL
jgi:hypothetical protein